jgi:thiol-disulfide isomerase/thioredoxin
MHKFNGLSEKFKLLFFSFISFCNVYSQHTISGDFPYLAGQYVRLIGFKEFSTYTIDSVKVSEKGTFLLSYNLPNNEKGMGYLSAEDKKVYFVVLADEEIELKGEVLSFPETIVCLKGKENQLFIQYASDHPKRQQAKSAWDYLNKLYQQDKLFLSQKKSARLVVKEINRINKEDQKFLSDLSPDTYISWYLPVRKLVGSVATVAQYRPAEIPATIAAFRKLDYSDQRLYSSGLLKEAIESQYWLLENMGKSLDSVFLEMNISTDYLLQTVQHDTEKYNSHTSFLFNLLESHSLFAASEYLALKVLNQNSCLLEEGLANQLESYRKMKVGNTAPDIQFSVDAIKNGNSIESPKSLSEVQSKFKLVFFGASWCPMCVDEMTRLMPFYEKWKAKGVEIVFVSLDTDKKAFADFTSAFPFISSCDYKKWNTPAAKSYYISGTPTLFLLDADQKILLRPVSLTQIDSWLDYYGNK